VGCATYIRATRLAQVQSFLFTEQFWGSHAQSKLPAPWFFMGLPQILAAGWHRYMTFCRFDVRERTVPFLGRSVMHGGVANFFYLSFK
jgi:hypothetical protein